MIVVDTNVIVYLLRPSSWQQAALALFADDPEWVAPALWRSELRDVLSLSVRRNDLTMNQAMAVYEEAENIIEHSPSEPESRQILELAHASGCSAYDCEYIALALTLGVPLITMDKQVLKAFPTLAVPLTT